LRQAKRICDSIKESAMPDQGIALKSFSKEVNYQSQKDNELFLMGVGQNSTIPTARNLTFRLLPKLPLICNQKGC
jgi:hypothetical protein